MTVAPPPMWVAGARGGARVTSSAAFWPNNTSKVMERSRSALYKRTAGRPDQVCAHRPPLAGRRRQQSPDQPHRVSSFLLEVIRPPLSEPSPSDVKGQLQD